MNLLNLTERITLKNKTINGTEQHRDIFSFFGKDRRNQKIENAFIKRMVDWRDSLIATEVEKAKKEKSYDYQKFLDLKKLFGEQKTFWYICKKKNKKWECLTVRFFKVLSRSH